MYKLDTSTNPAHIVAFAESNAPFKAQTDYPVQYAQPLYVDQKAADAILAEALTNEEWETGRTRLHGLPIYGADYFVFGTKRTTETERKGAKWVEVPCYAPWTLIVRETETGLHLTVEHAGWYA